MYELYIDDSGSPKPNPLDPTPYFALGGVLIHENDNEKIRENVGAFKNQWGISADVPLHGSEIRSRKERFKWLDTISQDERNRFFTELTQMITSCPLIVTACVISRAGYCDRYLERYSEHTWEMMKTAFVILLERTAKFAARRDSRVMVYYERSGKEEDRRINRYFRELRSSGHPFSENTAAKYDPLAANELAYRLRRIEGKTKENVILQLADLCLYPLAQVKTYPTNRAFHAMQSVGMLIDSQVPPEAVEAEGIKYSCF